MLSAHANCFLGFQNPDVESIDLSISRAGSLGSLAEVVLRASVQPENGPFRVGIRAYLNQSRALTCAGKEYNNEK